MDGSKPETVVAIYRVQAGREEEFTKLLEKHHPTLRRAGLVTETKPVVYRGLEKRMTEPIFFEIFTWVDGKAADTAHNSPEVMKIWEAMGALVEEREGKPKFEFPHVERIEVAWEG